MNANRYSPPRPAARYAGVTRRAAAVVALGCTAAWTSPVAALPDLVPYHPFGGWDGMIIMRNDQSVTETVAIQEPGPLQYWPYHSFNWRNSGTSPAYGGPTGPPRIGIFVSGVLEAAYSNLDPIPPGAEHNILNAQGILPPEFGSGLHTVRIFADYLEEVEESVEGNNRSTDTFRWEGFEIPIGSKVEGNVPRRDPAGSGPYYDVHGVRGTTGSGYWYAFASMPRSYSDLDMRLHTVEPMNVPAQGYDTYVEWSANVGQGDLDFVVINRNFASGGTYWGSVVSFEDAPLIPTDVAFVEDQGLLSLGTNGPFTLGAPDILALHEFYNPDPDRSYRVRVEILTGDADVGLTVFDGQQAFYAMNDGESSDAAGEGEDELLVFDAPVPAYHGIAIWKPNLIGSLSNAQYNVIVDDLANMTPTHPTGWWGPIVPRATTDATPASVLLPSTLPGNTLDTSFNWATRNQGPVDVPSVTSAVYVDDEPRWAFSPGAVPSESDALATNSPQGAIESLVRGGRHHVRSEADFYDEVAERYETDNRYVDWFVWSPLQLEPGVPVERAAPPEAFPLGWAPFPSCDGFRSEELAGAGEDGWWSVVGVLPHDAADEYDVKLSVPSTGSRDGFGPEIVQGISIGGGPAFGVINRNQTAATVVDVGVVEYVTTGDFTIEQANSRFEGLVETLPHFAQPNTIEPGHIVTVHELRIAPPRVGIPTTVTLQNVRGGADLALAIYGNETDHGSNNTSLFGADSGGPGAHESLTATFLDPDFYGFVVYKRRPDDIALSAFYRLVVGDVVVDVTEPSPAPAALQIAAPAPNPFRTSTALAFDLPSASDVRVTVFDATGRRVRRLLDSHPGAGRHEIIWDGRDRNGQSVTPGVYFVEIRVADRRLSRRVVRVD